MSVTHAKLIVSGRVQKAGYRDFIDEAAYNLKLNGYAKNLKNGTVEIVCEGEKKAIEKFAKAIDIEKYPIVVENIEIEFSKVTCKFKTFDIIREKNIDLATYERMDAAARYMREMNHNIGGKIDNLGNKMDCVGKDVRGVGDKVDKLGNRIDTNFDKMEKKYQVIHEEVKSTNDNLTKMVDKFGVLVDNFTKMVQTPQTQQDKKQ